MKNALRKTGVLLVALIMIAALAACGNGSDTGGSGKLDEIRKAGKIVVCTDAAWAPYSYVGADGEIAGVDIDIANEIAEDLGVKLEVTHISFESIPTYLVNGDADMALSCITITDERKEEMDFSVPYTTVQQYIVVMADDDEITTMETLAGKTIGTHLGTTGDNLVSEQISDGVLKDTGTKNKQYKALPDAGLAMKNGELSAIVCDSGIAENLVASNDGAFKCFPVKYDNGEESEIEQIGIAFNKGDDDLVEAVNEILEGLIEEGAIDDFYAKHSEASGNID